MSCDRAKEYLNKIMLLQDIINGRVQQLEKLKELSVSISVNACSGKVQTSGNKSKLENDVIEYIELEESVRNMICDMELEKNNIISMIYKIKNSKYIDVLIDKYVNGLSLMDIASRMSFEYKYLCKIHGHALIQFEKVIDSEESRQEDDKSRQKDDKSRQKDDKSRQEDDKSRLEMC